jgi:hypothetical protein
LTRINFISLEKKEKEKETKGMIIKTKLHFRIKSIHRNPKGAHGLKDPTTTTKKKKKRIKPKTSV